LFLLLFVVLVLVLALSLLWLVPSGRLRGDIPVPATCGNVQPPCSIVDVPLLSASALLIRCGYD
jgi:hypothetical protein